jgi:hypothetical protein
VLRVRQQSVIVPVRTNMPLARLEHSAELCTVRGLIEPLAVILANIHLLQLKGLDWDLPIDCEVLCTRWTVGEVYPGLPPP